MRLDGAKIRAFLERNEKSKEWLAAQIDCSIDTVNRMLGGKIPGGELLVALAKVMGCQVEDLIAPGEAEVAFKRSA